MLGVDSEVLKRERKRERRKGSLLFVCLFVFLNNKK